MSFVNLKKNNNTDHDQTIFISYTYLLMILPIGVVSKNDIGKRIVVNNTLLCNALDAFIQAITKLIVKHSNTKAKNI